MRPRLGRYCINCRKEDRRDYRVCPSCGQRAHNLILYVDAHTAITETCVVSNDSVISLRDILKLTIEINGVRLEMTPHEAALFVTSLAIAQGPSVKLAKPPNGAFYQGPEPD